MKKVMLILFVLIGLFLFFLMTKQSPSSNKTKIWDFQSIDTMKYSRDLSREKLTDQSFNQVIDTQVKNIAATGVTHVAIATPYDEEFTPILYRWVAAARKYNLHVWFRGNFSGWEKWFGYSEISRSEHIKKSTAFILKHPELFMDGDIFSACPECENGGPGDPRKTGDVTGHRQFLIDEYMATKTAFGQINRKVASNYDSMNGDVARIIMDKETTKKLDGIVVIDHYVATPEQLILDIKAIAKNSGGKVVLGEFGAPIPDIHGEMSEDEQAAWVENTLKHLVTTPQLVGMSYWVNIGGSTSLWDDAGKAKKAVATITKYFSPKMIKGSVSNEIGQPLAKAQISTDLGEFTTDKNGDFFLPVVSQKQQIVVQAQSYNTLSVSIENADFSVSLPKSQENFLFKVRKFLYKYLQITTY